MKKSCVLVGWQLRWRVPPPRIRKLQNTEIVEIFAPEVKGTVDDLDVILYGLELLEIPLKGLEILQKGGLPVGTRHGGDELVGEIGQLVRKRVSDETQFLDGLQTGIGVA